MSNDATYGFELPLLLFGGFRSIIDELHAELARRGHPTCARPTASRCRPSGWTGPPPPRRAAGSASPSRPRARPSTGSRTSATWKRSGDDTDRRRKLVRITPRGLDALALSAAIFEDIRARWAGRAGPATGWPSWKPACAPWLPAETYRLDVPGWFGA